MFPKYGLYGNHMIQRFAKLHETVVSELCFNRPHSILGAASQASCSDHYIFCLL